MKKVLKYANILGCKLVVFGSPKNRSYVDKYDDNIATTFFKSLNETAKQYNVIICGTDNGTAWVLANLAHVKEFPGSVLCIDSSVAAYFEMGTDGGDAAAKTALNAIANIDTYFNIFL